jgi:hypothetical protein
MSAHSRVFGRPGAVLALAALLGGLLLVGCAAGEDGLAVGDTAPAVGSSALKADS